MNQTELLDNSHLTVIQTLDNLPDEEWDVPGACGNWSIKEILAHLTSYERLLVEACNVVLGNKDKSTPYLAAFGNSQDTFNDAEVAKRKYNTAQQVLDEYNDTQLEATSLLALIPAEALQKPGFFPSSFGSDGSLNGLLTIISRHTIRHCDEMKAFRNRIK